jgi:hypothetical protein
MPGDRRYALRFALLAAGGALVFVLLIAARQNGPQWFVHFGRVDSTITPYARQVLGDDIVTPAAQGTDGQTFWLLARDPLLVHTDVVETYADRPVYRAQRVLYPLAAAPWRVFGEDALFWALVLTNVVLIGVGTYWTTQLAFALGLPGRAGIAFVLNPGVLAGLLLDGSDVLAVSLLVAGVLAWQRRREGWAALAFAGAALAKEVTLLGPAALFLLSVRKRPRAALTMAVPAALAAGAWGLYIRSRLGTTETKVQEFTTPLYGVYDSWERSWRPFKDYGNALVALALLAIVVAAVVLWWRDRTSLVTVVALPFCILFLFLSAQVIALPTNSLRALAPAITFVILAAYGLRGRGSVRAAPATRRAG